MVAKEMDRRGWNFPKKIDRVYDSSYIQQSLGWKPKKGPMELVSQYDNEDYELLPPVLNS